MQEGRERNPAPGKEHARERRATPCIPSALLLTVFLMIGGCRAATSTAPESRTFRLRVQEGVVDIVSLFDPDASHDAEGPVLLFLDPVFYDPGVLVEGRYAPATYFARRGFRVYVARNLSPRGQVFDNTPSLIKSMLETLRGSTRAKAGKSGREPIFLFAISPGGQAAISFAVDSAANEIAGIVFVGTGFDTESMSGENFVAKHPALRGRDLRDICGPGHPCYPFVTPEIERRGFRFRRFPGAAAFPSREILASLTLPLAIVVGEADTISPPATARRLLDLIHRSPECAQDRISPCSLFLNASRKNGFSRDYDGFDLVSAEEAPDEIYHKLEKWILDQVKSGPRSLSRR